MAQIVTTRLIHGAFATSPGSGALLNRSEKLRPNLGFEGDIRVLIRRCCRCLLKRCQSKRIQQRLALYQGVCPLHMEFADDAEETFSSALALLQNQGMVREGEPVALVQSGRQPIWQSQSTHNIQVRKA